MTVAVSEQSGLKPHSSEAVIFPTISALSNECAREISRIVDDVCLSNEKSRLEIPVEDVRGRFRIWAANIGALQPAHSPKSLDHRLRDSKLTRSGVISGLERLHTCALRGE